MRSIRFINRARRTDGRSERGFALAIAIVLAVLYFGLIELLLIDSSRDLAEARRFRARVIAWTLAENAAERAAHSIAVMTPATLPPMRAENEQGTMRSSVIRAPQNFYLVGEGETKGVIRTKAKVTVIGRVDSTKVPPQVYIDYTMHVP